MEKKDSLGKGILLAIYIALKPIYLRSSGTLQLCDMFLVVVSLYLFLSKKGKFRLDYSTTNFIKLFAGLCVYQFFINLIWTAITGRILIRSTLYYAFNFVALFDFVIIGKEIGIDKIKKATITGGFISLIISSIGIALNLGGARGVGFFNNPNQLGYYALILFTIVLLCGDKTKPVVRIAMIVMSVWAIISSSSKAALIGVIITAVMYILFYNEEINVKKIAMQLVGLAAVSVLIYLIFFSTSSAVLSNRSMFMMRRRILNMSSENDTALGSGRGYDRIKEIGLHILWGVGEGAYDRFQTMTNMEVHSTFAALLVSYGLIGLLGYVILFFRGIKNKDRTKQNLVIMTGLLFYQISHNGIRNTLLWLILAILLMEKTNTYSYFYETE